MTYQIIFLAKGCEIFVISHDSDFYFNQILIGCSFNLNDENGATKRNS